MNRFVESPTPYLLIGLAFESLLLILYLQTRRVWFLAGMVLVVLLAAAGILFERVVVTDREAIESTVYELAASVEANDLAAVLSHISPQATQTRQAAQREMSRYRILLARIVGKLQTEMFPQTSPPTARVRLQGVFKVKEARSGLEGGGRLEFVLTFGREGGQWRLLEFSWSER